MNPNLDGSESWHAGGTLASVSRAVAGYYPEAEGGESGYVHTIGYLPTT